MRNCWFSSPERGPIGSLWFNTVVLTNDPIKILGMHFSHHSETKTERNFLSIVKKHRILSMYGMQEHLL